MKPHFHMKSLPELDNSYELAGHKSAVSYFERANKPRDAAANKLKIPHQLTIAKVRVFKCCAFFRFSTA